MSLETSTTPSILLVEDDPLNCFAFETLFETSGHVLVGRAETGPEAVSLAARWCRDRWGPMMNPAWRTSPVLSLCQTIHADNRYDLLPVLADALQDAGCENPDILDHLRGPGPHVRECHVLDLFLGKE